MNLVTIASFVLGLVAGVIAFALFLPSLNKRSQARHQVELQKHEALINDLRQERSDDRETNRRLRHELATKTPANYEAVQSERDQAVAERDALRAELHQATAELAIRDRSLREARLAIHDIRVQLERDRIGGTNNDGFDASQAITTGPVASENEQGIEVDGTSSADTEIAPAAPADTEIAPAAPADSVDTVEAGATASEIVDRLPAEPDVGRGVSTAGAFDAVTIPEPTTDVGDSVPAALERDGAEVDGVPADDDGTVFDDDGRQPEPSTVFFGDYPLGGTSTN